MIKTDARGSWPNEADFETIVKAADGHFIVAATAERFIGDQAVKNPQAQLSSVVNMLKRLDAIGVNNPLEALDAFYSRILAKVPERTWPVVAQVLGLCAHNLDRIYQVEERTRLRSAEQLWLFLRMDQVQFYSAMENLYSVLDIPPPGESSKKPLAFYHKSFPDYLTDARRSGKFFVSKEQACYRQFVCAFHWHNLTLQFKNQDHVTPEEYRYAESMLRAWFDGGIDGDALEKFQENLISNHHLCEGDTFGSELFNVLHEFSFNLIPSHGGKEWCSRANMLPMLALKLARDTRANPHFVRTEIRNGDIDLKLLQHLSLLTDGEPVEPLDLTVADPFGRMGRYTNKYVIVGNGSRSGLACVGKGFREWTGNGYYRQEWQAIWLGPALPPTENQRYLYHDW